MKDELPSNNTTILKKVLLSEDQKKLMVALDELFPQYIITGTKPSSMLEGAIFAIRGECINNPDMIAQAAHSLREIVYHLKKRRSMTGINILNECGGDNNPKVKHSDTNNNQQFQNNELGTEIFNSNFPNYKNYSSEIDDLFGIFTDIAHHGYAQNCLILKALRKYLDEFVMVMLKATRQRDKEITDIENTGIVDIVSNNSTDKDE